MLCCPRCGGTDIYEDMGGYTGNIYRCKKCGYRGAFILEVSEEKGHEEPGNDPHKSRGKG
jgi:transposase-like protein